MDIEKKEALLKKLYEDYEICKDYLKSVHLELKNQGVTNYPIFAVSQELLKLGMPIIKKEEANLTWNFFASHLEEFAIKEIVAEDKIKEFQRVYKEKADELCLFVALEEEFNFVFLPA